MFKGFIKGFLTELKKSLKEQRYTCGFLQFLIPAAMGAMGAVKGALTSRAQNAAQKRAQMINRYAPLTGRTVDEPNGADTAGNILGGALGGGLSGFNLAQAVSNQPKYDAILDRMGGGTPAVSAVEPVATSVNPAVPSFSTPSLPAPSFTASTGGYKGASLNPGTLGADATSEDLMNKLVSTASTGDLDTTGKLLSAAKAKQTAAKKTKEAMDAHNAIANNQATYNEALFGTQPAGFSSLRNNGSF